MKKYKNIIEAAHKLTGSAARTKAGAWKSLREKYLTNITPRWQRKDWTAEYFKGRQAETLYERGGYATMRDAWKRAQWNDRAEHGADTIMLALGMDTRAQDLLRKRPRDAYNRKLRKERRTIARDQYGALYIERLAEYAYTGENGFRRAWLESSAARPEGWENAWKCVREIENNAAEHGGWEERSEWDSKGRGEQVTVDLYGIDAANDLYVIQVRQSFREHKNWYLSVRKSYFMIGHNENGNAFAHPVESRVIHAAIKRNPEASSPVQAAQAWIWGIDEKRLPEVLRNGDVALIPARLPKEVMIFPGGSYRVDEGIASDHQLVADEIRANGAIYALNPTLYHRKGQHPEARGNGWFKVVVGRRADFWSFARPTMD